MNKKVFFHLSTAALFTAVLPISTWAAVEGISFQHKDWEMVCDNAGTCRAIGYSPETQQQQLAVHLERAAGAQALVSARVSLPDEEPMLKSLQVELPNLGKTTITLKENVGKLTQQQTSELIKAIQGAQPIRWQSGKKQWLLSTEGSSATLLKMDEFQRRIATSSALIRKGNQSSHQVLAPQALPVIQWHKPKSNAEQQLSANQPQAKKLMSLLKANLQQQGLEEACPLLFETDPEDALIIYPLNAQQRLVEASCWRAAYNVGSGYWLVNAGLDQVQDLVSTSANAYDDGQLFETQKGRGIGDCITQKEWVWNGKTFQLSYETAETQCRGFAGGAGDLPIYRSKVVEFKNIK